MLRVVDDYQPPSEDVPRITRALRAWKDWKVYRIKPKRAFVEGKARLTYVKDLLDQSLIIQQPLVLANLDILPCPDIRRKLADALRKHGAVASYRREIPVFTHHLSDAEIRKCTRVYAGIDLIAVTPAWWKEHRDKYPDMLFATEAWDYLLRWFIPENGGKLFHYLIYHVDHGYSTEAKKDSAARKHNIALAEPFLRARHITPYWEDPQLLVGLNPTPTTADD